MYTPERGIDLDMLRNDVKYLKKRYHLDAKGKSEGELVDRGDLWNCLFGKQRQSGVSGALQFEVDRQLRGDAAETRQAQQMA